MLISTLLSSNRHLLMIKVLRTLELMTLLQMILAPMSLTKIRRQTALILTPRLMIHLVKIQKVVKNQRLKSQTAKLLMINNKEKMRLFLRLQTCLQPLS